MPTYKVFVLTKVSHSEMAEEEISHPGLNKNEYSIGDNGKALLLWGENEQAIICTVETGEIEVEMGKGAEPETVTLTCHRELMMVGVQREPGGSFPCPETGEDSDEEEAGKPAVMAKRQLVCEKHGLVDTFNTIVLVEDLPALEPLWYNAT